MKRKNQGGSQFSGLDVVSRLRYLSSIAKVSGTCQYIHEKLKLNKDPIVVFAWFKETCFQMKSTLEKSVRAEHLTGDLIHQHDRQRLVDRFQSGNIDVLICTYGVGSTGLTLTRSHTVILVDRPWTPGDVLQAEDRIRRIGQKSAHVESIWITAMDMDVKLDKLIQTKDNSCQKILSDGTVRKFFKVNRVKKETEIETNESDIINFFGGNNRNENSKFCFRMNYLLIKYCS